MDLNSLNLDSLGDIVSSLSKDDIDKLNSLASEFFSDKGDEPSKKESPSSPENGGFDLFSGLDPNMIMKISSILSKLNSAPKDPRCDFLTSLKPLLSKEKQQKADEAIKMLQLLSLLPLLQDLQ